MTWTLNVTGHEDTKEAEGVALEAARRAVAILDDEACVLNAQFNGMYGGAVGLTPEKEGEDAEIGQEQGQGDG